MLLRGRLEETPGASFTVEATTSESQAYFSRFNFEVSLNGSLHGHPWGLTFFVLRS